MGGRRLSVRLIIGTSYTRAHTMRVDNQLLHGDLTKCEENFTGSITNVDARFVSGS